MLCDIEGKYSVPLHIRVTSISFIDTVSFFFMQELAIFGYDFSNQAKLIEDFPRVSSEPVHFGFAHRAVTGDWLERVSGVGDYGCFEQPGLTLFDVIPEMIQEVKGLVTGISLDKVEAWCVRAVQILHGGVKVGVVEMTEGLRARWHLPVTMMKVSCMWWLFSGFVAYSQSCAVQWGFLSLGNLFLFVLVAFFGVGAFPWKCSMEPMVRSYGLFVMCCRSATSVISGCWQSLVTVPVQAIERFMSTSVLSRVHKLNPKVSTSIAT